MYMERNDTSNTEAYSKPCQIAKMECFAKIVNSLKRSISDARQGLDTSLNMSFIHTCSEVIAENRRFYSNVFLLNLNFQSF